VSSELLRRCYAEHFEGAPVGIAEAATGVRGSRSRTPPVLRPTTRAAPRIDGERPSEPPDLDARCGIASTYPAASRELRTIASEEPSIERTPADLAVDDRWNARIVEALKEHVDHDLTVLGPGNNRPWDHVVPDLSEPDPYENRRYELICRTCDAWVMWAPPLG
jgi:hypothetical protein